MSAAATARSGTFPAACGSGCALQGRACPMPGIPVLRVVSGPVARAQSLAGA